MGKSTLCMSLILVFVVFTGCEEYGSTAVEQQPIGESQLEPVVSGMNGSPAMQRNFRTHLSGDGVVPAVETEAQGQAKFQLNKEGDQLSFKLIVANIKDVRGAHIHKGAAGMNGGIVVPLFGSPFTDPVTVNGVLAEGVITASDVVGSIAGDFDALISAIRSGEAYVQVHTNAHLPGEIRGQIF